MFLSWTNHKVHVRKLGTLCIGDVMNRRYVFYLLGSVAALTILATTSYGALFFASVVGMVVFGSSVIAFAALISASENVGHRVARVWNAVIAERLTNAIFRH